MVGQTRSHSGAAALEGLVTTAEVVERDVQSDRGLVIVERLAEGVSQSSQSPKMHTHNQIGAFDMRSRNAAQIRLWNSAIREAERQLVLAKRRVAGLEKTVTNWTRLRDEGMARRGEQHGE